MATPGSGTDDAPLLTYPCAWAFTVIGRDEGELRRAIAAVIGHDCCTVTRGHTSRGGKYVSLRVELEVQSAEERHALYRALDEHAATKVVM